MVDLVGIEPTTSSMPCSFKGSRSLVFKHLRTGISGRNGVFGALSGQFPAKISTQDQTSCMGGDLYGQLNSRTHPTRIGAVFRIARQSEK